MSVTLSHPLGHSQHWSYKSLILKVPSTFLNTLLLYSPKAAPLDLSSLMTYRNNVCVIFIFQFLIAELVVILKSMKRRTE